MRPERIQIANDVAAVLTGSDFLYFVSYKGLKVKEVTAFRTQLEKAGAECRIMKNTIVKKAAELNGMTALASIDLKGDTAVVFGKGDAGAVAKVIDEYSKSTKGVLTAKSGYFDGALLSDQDVKDIAGLPSKDALRAQVLGLLVAVPTGLVRVLNAKAASIINVINAYKNKLEEQN